MSRALPKYNKRRVALIGGAAAVALTGAIVAGTALAGETGSKGGSANAKTLAGPGTISCPDVTGQLPAIPASAQAEVDRNLAQLQTQIDEANKRLVETVGQGGPNFVQNAILGPLEDKRVAALNRIETSIGRAAAKPEGLEAFAPCTLNGAGAGAEAGAGQEAGAGAEAGGGAAASPSETAGAEQGAGEPAGGEQGGDTGEAGGAAGAISCPDVAGQLPAVPASAQAEVDRNLTLLQTQIDEANKRLVETVGQGGPNFVQNAILGPLEDKRVATVNRIATAIGRTAEKPQGLDSLAACTLTQ
jgi:F0F1-type ATP synthase membrane subunit b/b'